MGSRWCSAVLFWSAVIILIVGLSYSKGCSAAFFFLLVRGLKSHDAEGESSSSEDEVLDDAPASSIDDDAAKDGDEFLLQDVKEKMVRVGAHDNNKNQTTEDSSRSMLPGGYNPRHREPSYRYYSHLPLFLRVVLLVAIVCFAFRPLLTL
ncbi:uncharacterized protein LOC116206644 [Punica granatum]|uniref:Uncharacterized protein LOC116206644 n=1 Tax=Punica granatum TaxID=22663 RepID=A0A6P8DT57_PUNGR|nr:uncharacterized protein LOC116206644 [Punica granatum]